MKAFTLFIFIQTLVAHLCLSQPVISYSAIAGPGISGTVFVSNSIPSPGASGANVTWNFSSLTFTPIGTMSMVSCGSTPYSSSFPSANYCATISSTMFPTQYSYNILQSNTQEIVGDNISATGGTTYTPNAKTILIFPFNYTNSFSDAYQCSSCSPSSVTRTYDGYGTLIVNGKTYYNVARVYSVFGSGGSYYYHYYNTNPVYPILSFDPAGSSVSLIEIPSATSVFENINQLERVLLYPNIASSYIKVSNYNDFEISVTFLSITGEVIKTTNIYPNTTQHLDIQNMNNGMYFIRVSNINDLNQTFIQKIIINN